MLDDEFAPDGILPEPEADGSEEGQNEGAASDVETTPADPLAGVEVAADANLPDAQAVVTIRTSGGDTRYVPTDGSATVGSLIVSAGLNMPAGFQVWLNGAQLNVNDVVPAGSTLTILTSVKGGVA
jgi:hypothetical protein